MCCPEGCATQGRRSAAKGGDDDEDKVSDDERKKGVQIVRVAVKIAGRERQLRYRIMPDPKDDEKCYICRKEPESEEMVPVVHRGAPRYVERSRDGSWELV